MHRTQTLDKMELCITKHFLKPLISATNMFTLVLMQHGQWFSVRIFATLSLEN